MEILSTLIDVDVDEAWVAGRHLTRGADAVRSAIGVTGQFSAVDNLLTAEENLLLMADLYHLDRREGKRRAKDLMRRFDLSEVAGKTAVTFSGGMRRKLDLAMTLVGDPRIIFLDEPTTGLDPRSRRTMWEQSRPAGRPARRPRTRRAGSGRAAALPQRGRPTAAVGAR